MTGIETLFELNRAHAAAFEAQALSRRQYRSQHPTEILVMKCMDGRLHLPIITKTPLGILQPLRNIGGKFNLGWPYFGEVVRDFIDYSVSKGRDCLAIVTYHFAKGDLHRGCRGFDYDTGTAITFTKNLKEQFDRRIPDRQVVYTIQCGIETDEDALLFHGTSGQVLDMAELSSDTAPRELKAMLRSLYPDMPDQILNDLLPLAVGNLAHIAEIRASNRPLAEAEHREWVLGIGRGFDWLHKSNTALLVGPFNPDLASVVETAAGLILGNLEDGRISKAQGVVVVSSGPYREAVGLGKNFAIEKALFLTEFARDIIRTRVPGLLPYVHFLSVTVDMNTRKFDFFEQASAEEASQAAA